MTTERRSVFVTGGTGYMGRRLIPQLLGRGHEVRALVRAGSEQKLPPGCAVVLGNALDGASYADKIEPADTFVQLVGVSHPSPAKAAEFRRVDLPAGLGAVAAAKSAQVRHFVYLSVAHPAPMMRAYIEVRSECEAAIESTGLNATILRPCMCWARGTGGHTCLSRCTKSRSSCRRPAKARAGWVWSV